MEKILRDMVPAALAALLPSAAYLVFLIVLTRFFCLLGVCALLSLGLTYGPPWLLQSSLHAVTLEHLSYFNIY